MNTQTQYLKQILFVSLISTILVACSVEQKLDTIDVIPEKPAIIDQLDPRYDPPMIMNPEDIVLPSADYIIEPQAQPFIPKAKTPLTRQQLFSGVLDVHNRVRAKHKLKPLKWSDKLAEYSQQWADHLGKSQSCKMYHRSGSPPHGENLYISSAVIWSEGNKEVARERNRVTIKNVVKAWTDEEQWYNYRTNSCQPGQQCGHYTQIVWRETTEVGCAVKFCGDQSQNWVCSYNPAGNYVGKRPY